MLQDKWWWIVAEFGKIDKKFLQQMQWFFVLYDANFWFER